jgi:hypothetical protein
VLGVGGTVVGTIDVESDRIGAFGPDDEALLAEAARSASPLLDPNHRLRDQRDAICLRNHIEDRARRPGDSRGRLAYCCSHAVTGASRGLDRFLPSPSAVRRCQFTGESRGGTRTGAVRGSLVFLSGCRMWPTGSDDFAPALAPITLHRGWAITVAGMGHRARTLRL